MEYLYDNTDMKNIYCISGLGADERVFMKLRLNGVKMVHLPWPEYDEHDELPCYAQKVAALIQEENPLIMGVSLGGMIGVEIAKMMPVKKLFLVSTAKTKSELPPYDGMFGKLIRSKVLPPYLYKWPNIFLVNRFGAETDEDGAILAAILSDSDGRFMKWAMRAVVLWNNETMVEPVVHIHGRKDRMLLPANVHADYWIDDGGHMMVYNRAGQVSEILNNELQKL